MDYYQTENIVHVFMYNFFLWHFHPILGHGLLLRGFAIIYWTHHTWYDSSGWVFSPTQRPLPYNTQHSQQTNIHALSWIRTHNPSKRAATDPCLRLCGPSDCVWWYYSLKIPGLYYLEINLTQKLHILTLTSQIRIEGWKYRIKKWGYDNVLPDWL
jgi:hypothetical protein